MPRTAYQGTPAWLEERRTGYGASDAPILIEGDEGAWRQLHGEKLGLLPDREASETMDLGKRIEHVILRLAAERLGEPIVRVNRIIRHPELPYVFASLDGRRKRGNRRPIEIKKWAFKGEEWGPAGSDVVPTRILYQVQQQIAVTGADGVDLFVLFGGAKVEPFTVGRDQSMIDEILELETAAWAYVTRGEMPPWPGQAPKRIVLAADEIAIDDTIRNLVDIHETADAQAKGAAQELKDAKARLRAALADVGAARGVMPDGRRVSVTHRPQDPSERTNWELVASASRKHLAAVDPSFDLDAIESMFTTTSAGQRPLRVTLGKESKNVAA